MDVHRLRHFLAVIEHGSIGRAAEALNISQPALSKSIRRLEGSLDAKLVDRGPYGVSPTVFGVTLADRARLILHEVRGAEQDIAALRDLRTGHVIVGAGPSIVTDLLPTAITALQVKRRGVRVTIREALMDMQLDALARGEIDITVGAFPESLSIEVTREPLFVDSTVVIARPQHPLNNRRRRQLEELSEWPWVLPAAPERVRDTLAAAFEAAGLEPPQPDVETNSAHCMKSVVTETDFLSFMPSRLIRHEVDAGLLAAIPIRDHAWQRAIEIVYRAQTILSPAARALVHELHDAVRADARRSPPAAILS